MSRRNTTEALTTFSSFRFFHFTALYNSWVCVSLLVFGIVLAKETVCFREGRLVGSGGRKFGLGVPGFRKRLWVKHTRCARIKTVMSVFVVCSYLGFGLKAARLAALGALNIEGMFM